MPFSLELYDNDILKILKGITGCSIIPLEFGPDGLFIDVGTDAKSAAYSMHFPRSYFNEYEFIGEKPEIYAIGSTNFLNLLKMLESAGLPINIESTLDGVIKFTTSDAGRHFRVKRLEGEYEAYMHKIRNKFSSIMGNSVAIVADIDVIPLKQALKQLKMISGNLVLNVKNDALELNAEGIEMEGDIVLNLNNELNGEWIGKFGADLLYEGVKMFETVDNMVLFLTDTMLFSVDKDSLYFRYVAAPQRR